jgi:hypothetical protein
MLPSMPAIGRGPVPASRSSDTRVRPSIFIDGTSIFPNISSSTPHLAPADNAIDDGVDRRGRPNRPARSGRFARPLRLSPSMPRPQWLVALEATSPGDVEPKPRPRSVQPGIRRRIFPATVADTPIRDRRLKGRRGRSTGIRGARSTAVFGESDSAGICGAPCRSDRRGRALAEWHATVLTLPALPF